MKNLTICDIREDVVESLNKSFKDVRGVKIKKKSILKTRADAFATAGNSFGDMGGGIDKVIDDSSNGEYQRLVQGKIRSECYGELPVGTAIYIPKAGRRKGLIYAPTMRIPGRIDTTINAYLAMRAILITGIQFKVNTVACSALGTGVGGLMPDDAADQMFLAFRMICGGAWKTIRHSIQAPYIMRN